MGCFICNKNFSNKSHSTFRGIGFLFFRMLCTFSIFLFCAGTISRVVYEILSWCKCTWGLWKFIELLWGMGCWGVFVERKNLILGWDINGVLALRATKPSPFKPIEF